MGSPGNPNWVLDFGLIEDISVPGGDLPPLYPPDFSCPLIHSLTAPPTNLSVALNDSNGNSDGFKESGIRKPLRSGSCNLTGSKVCRKKMRRNQLNDRFLELGSILDPARATKMDKAVISSAAVQMVSQLREEAQNLRESNDNLQEKINGLKNELSNEKQQLKVVKDNIEQRLKALNSQPGFPPHLPAIRLHFLHQEKMLAASWCHLLAIQQFPCGNIFLLLPLIPQRAMYSGPQLHKLAKARVCFLAQRLIAFVYTFTFVGRWQNSIWSLMCVCCNINFQL